MDLQGESWQCPPEEGTCKWVLEATHEMILTMSLRVSVYIKSLDERMQSLFGEFTD